jgi:hypothetical protein
VVVVAEINFLSCIVLENREARLGMDSTISQSLFSAAMRIFEGSPNRAWTRATSLYISWASVFRNILRVDVDRREKAGTVLSL